MSLALQQQLAERRRSGRQAEAEEVERGQGGDAARQLERQEGQRRHHRVGQHVLPHDLAMRQAERPRGGDVLEVARAEELGAHDAHEVDPLEQQQRREQRPEAGHQHRGDDDQHEQRRHR
jgi:hypothetical protein